MNKKNVNIKATSMPQKSEQFKIQKVFESITSKQRDLGYENKVYSRANHTE